QADRRDPAVLHAGGGGDRVNRREGCLPRVQVPAHQPVDVGPGGRGHHAGRVAGLAASLGRDDHAVRRFFRGDAVAFAERGGVRQRRVDLGHLHVVGARQVAQRRRDRGGEQVRPGQGGREGEKTHGRYPTRPGPKAWQVDRVVIDALLAEGDGPEICYAVGAFL